MNRCIRAVILMCIWSISIIGCSSDKSGVKVIGFLDVVEDATLAEARKGFKEALLDAGLSVERGNISFIERNAQGDIPTLVQALQYFQSKKVDCIAANSTLPTISAVQNTKDIPIFMMVAPEPWQAGLGKDIDDTPLNLYGVYETLDYLDSSFAIIQTWIPDLKKVGILYNQAETQSVNAMERIRAYAAQEQIQLIEKPVFNSSETQLVAEALLSQGIDAFFAMPDNIIFASFEVIAEVCNRTNTPIFTSESGLVARGAVAAYGADFFSWGYQSGQMAAKYLLTGEIPSPKVEPVKVRKKVYHPNQVQRYKYKPDGQFEPIKL